MAHEIGDKVSWQVGDKLCRGIVHEIYSRDHFIHSPLGIGQGRALLIELEDGKRVLKLENEIVSFTRKHIA
jgi:hypothetical protein